MTAPTPYLLFPGTTREALTFYAQVFSGRAQLNTFAEFGREDAPPEGIAHGILRDAPVTLYAADAAGEETPFRSEGLMFALLGTAEPDVLHRWFDALAEGGTVLDALQQRPWGAHDGQVRDRFGLTWLIGYET